MRPNISSQAVDLTRKKSPIREIMDYANPAYFEALGLKASEVISFAGGWVAHRAPDELQDVYGRICRDGALFHQSGGYSPTLGTMDCREAIVAFERDLYHVTTLTADQVVVGASSSQLALTLMRVLLNPGESVLLMDPTYCNIPLQLQTTIDVNVLRFPLLNPGTWAYDAEEKASAVAKMIRQQKPKVIILVSPDNPTSRVLPNVFVKAIVEAASDSGSFVLLDSAYKEIVFADEYPDYFSWGPSDHLIILRSNSKWCRGLGRRLGWIEAPAFVVAALESFQGSSILAPDSLHQLAFVEYTRTAIPTGSLRRYVSEVRQMYKRAADATHLALQELTGLAHTTPEGGLYTSIRVPEDGATFVTRLLREKAVLLVPGWGFGPSMRDAVRMSYGPLVDDTARIREGCRRMGELLSTSPKVTKSQHDR